MELDRLIAKKGKRLNELATALSKKLAATSEMRTMRFKDETLRVQCIIPRYAKEIIDDIDDELADFLGLSSTAQDFVVNYDYKYRMGTDVSDEEQVPASAN